MSPARIELLDALSKPGAGGRANEDRWRCGPDFALVIDGATGLGDARLVEEEGSDAAWLAEFAAAALAQRLATPGDTSLEDAALEDAALEARDIVRAVNLDLREALETRMRRRAAPGPRRIEDAPGYALPTAGLQWLRLRRAPSGSSDRPALLETAGLGDCALLLLEESGAFRRMTGSRRPRGGEQEAARRALQAAGGLDGAGAFLRRPQVLQGLRRARERHNTPGGHVWTLGVRAEAAEHLVVETCAIERPMLALLATDGLTELVDNYGAYDGPGLLRAAAEKGLSALAAQLRHIEQELDPDGARYPRFKQSDDATGVLLRISPGA